MFPLRDENPIQITPWVTLGLIGLNVIVFLYQMKLLVSTQGGIALQHFVLNYAAIPIEIVHGQNLPHSQDIRPYASIITSMFLHANWAHLLGNVWFLWIFGDNVEEQLGHLRYLVFYLLTGIAAALLHVFLNSNSTIPVLGASGAISGVLGAYIILFPNIRIRTLLFLGFFIQIVHVPAMFFLGLWFLVQAFGGLAAGGEEGGVAFAAHIGGSVAGAALLYLWTRPSSNERVYRHDPTRQLRHFKR